MKLRGIDFGPIFGASGVEGFFGEGYWFHKPWKALGLLSFKDMTFVSKTATLEPVVGNMPLWPGVEPADPFPNCIRAQPKKGNMLNAVGLSNPGLPVLLETGRWQCRTEPFLISVMSIAKTAEDRLGEIVEIAGLLEKQKKEFRAPFGVQVNLSCPNTDEDPTELIKESAGQIDALSVLGVPIMPKYSVATAPIDAMLELEKHPHCDAICVSNTIPYDYLFNRQNGLSFGEQYWGDKTSPLKDFGGGSLSGNCIKLFVLRYILELRRAGFKKPINGGGGIMEWRDIGRFDYNGADSFFIGTVAALRPWRVPSIIKYAHNLRELKREKERDQNANYQTA